MNLPDLLTIAADISPKRKDPMTHHCPIHGCMTIVDGPRLMCPYHWRLVPPELKQEVYRSRRIASRSNPRTVSGRTAWEAWERARERAIEAVRRTLEACA